MLLKLKTPKGALFLIGAILLSFLSTNTFSQQTIRTAQSGNINDCATYNSVDISNNGNNRLPDYNDIIDVQANHTLTVNTPYSVRRVNTSNTNTQVTVNNTLNLNASSGNGSVCPPTLVTINLGSSNGAPSDAGNRVFGCSGYSNTWDEAFRRLRPMPCSIDLLASDNYRYPGAARYVFDRTTTIKEIKIRFGANEDCDNRGEQVRFIVQLTNRSDVTVIQKATPWITTTGSSLSFSEYTLDFSNNTYSDGSVGIEIIVQANSVSCGSYVGIPYDLRFYGTP